MEKYGKLLFSSFAEILCFCACGERCQSTVLCQMALGSGWMVTYYGS